LNNSAEGGGGCDQGSGLQASRRSDLGRVVESSRTRKHSFRNLPTTLPHRSDLHVGSNTGFQSDVNRELGEVRAVGGEHSGVLNEVESSSDLIGLIQSFNKVVSFDFRSIARGSRPTTASIPTGNLCQIPNMKIREIKK
jgi:hypothetical protein